MNICCNKTKVIPMKPVIKTYKGKNFYQRNRKKTPNVIVFDLDETLGSYSDLYILWDYLQNIIEFNDLLDLFPEFSRYKIIHILDYIYQQKMSGKCENIYIYTNNQCSYDFVELISKYYSYKLGIEKGELFDQIIRSFKIGNRIIEVARTTQQKTYNDFIRCTLLPPKTQIFFIDNSYFPDMEYKRIYYIQPLSYHHHLSKEEIISRLDKRVISRPILNNIYDELTTFSDSTISKHVNYIEIKKKMDVFVAKKIMYHIKDFFHITRLQKNTRKNLQLSAKYTRKISHSHNHTPSKLNVHSPSFFEISNSHQILSE